MLFSLASLDWRPRFGAVDEELAAAPRLLGGYYGIHVRQVVAKYRGIMLKLTISVASRGNVRFDEGNIVE